MLIILVSSIMMTGCFDSGSEDADEPVKKGSLSVTAQYTGTLTDETQLGDGKLYVYLFETAPVDSKAVKDYDTSTPAAVELSTDYIIELNDLPVGDYYMMIFYDYKKHTNTVPGKSDRYTLYNAQTCSNNGALLTAVTITEDNTTEITGVVVTNQQIADGGVFQTGTTLCDPN
jgi:hypothetical protein